MASGGFRAPEVALAKLRKCREALTELTYLWPRAKEQAIWWDDYRGVFATRRHRRTYDALFGTYAHLRSLSQRRLGRPQLREARLMASRQRWQGPIQLGVPLPDEAVLIPPIASKDGFVFASADANAVLKVTYGRSEVDVELDCWQYAIKAGIQEHAPEVLDHGSTADGGRWMLTRLARNTDPIDRGLNPFADRSKLWNHWMRWKILPVMQRFYDAAGVERVSCQGMLLQVSQWKPDGLPAGVLLGISNLAADALSKARHGVLETSIIHRDIIPSHLHRDGNDWWLIDWGSAGRDVIAKEMFRNYFWTPVDHSECHLAFWAWLRGGRDLGQLPETLRNEIETYLTWYSDWQGTDMDPESLRGQLLVALLVTLQEVTAVFALAGHLHDAETMTSLPAWVRTISGQLRALRVSRLCSNLAQ